MTLYVYTRYICMHECMCVYVCARVCVHVCVHAVHMDFMCMYLCNVLEALRLVVYLAHTYKPLHFTHSND